MKRSVEIMATVIIETPKNKMVTYKTSRHGTNGSVPKENKCAWMLTRHHWMLYRSVLAFLIRLVIFIAGSKIGEGQSSYS